MEVDPDEQPIWDNYKHLPYGLRHAHTQRVKKQQQNLIKASKFKSQQNVLGVMDYNISLLPIKKRKYEEMIMDENEINTKCIM